MANQQQTVDWSNQTTDWVRVKPVGLVPPGSSSLLAGGSVGTVRDGGYVDLDDADDVFLKLAEPDTIHDGERVYVARLRGGVEFAKIHSVYLREKAEDAREKRREEARRARERDRKRRNAEAFWDRYEIPFEYDVAVKGRLSGLTRGSNGNGRNSQTVEHLWVKESFSEDRLSRSADSYLCDDNASFRFDEVRHLDGDDNEYMPEVTCKTCRERMRRWWEGAE